LGLKNENIRNYSLGNHLKQGSRLVFQQAQMILGQPLFDLTSSRTNVLFYGEIFGQKWRNPSLCNNAKQLI
jgi:hypothetical protein